MITGTSESGTCHPTGSPEGGNSSEFLWRSRLSDEEVCDISVSSEPDAPPCGHCEKTLVGGEKPHTRLPGDRSISMSSSLLLHRCAHAGGGPHTCQTCSKTFVSSSHLAVHLRTHASQRRYKCSTCNKVFTQPAHLVRHRATHTGKKPFRCPDCGKSFGRASHLKTHQRLHTGEKPFKCTQCEKAFTQKAGLIVHVRQHTGERPFVCATCGKAFCTSTHLLSHKAMESNEGGHTCTRCQKGFGSASALRQHERSHWSGAVVPHCGVCCSALISPSDLWPELGAGGARHVYHCKVCGRIFSCMSAFKRHCERHLRQPSRAWGTDDTDNDDSGDPSFLPYAAASAPRYASEVNTRSKTRAKRKMEAQD
ncbi:gastrula zinc finger protein XlCGF52.1 [Electrophorus electricus]|uniref:gastrula zinc finger protein XlCGF52.1 n=1 Tax=Electrophorus electricus TaxID=8005 RepID=UPI0015D065EA|nr:gastrula zinc finger protein XlCGF52.1 [Electrophorus electricus]